MQPPPLPPMLKKKDRARQKCFFKKTNKPQTSPLGKGFVSKEKQKWFFVCQNCMRPRVKFAAETEPKKKFPPSLLQTVKYTNTQPNCMNGERELGPGTE